MKKIILIIALGGCVANKADFTTKPEFNKMRNGSLDINGVYWSPVESSTSEKIIWAFCLYRNGVALMYNSVPMDSVNNQDLAKKLTTTMNYDNVTYKVKQAGGYRVNNRSIEIQVFRFISYGGFEVCTFKGDILNDTTIHIISCSMKSRSQFCRSNFFLKFLPMKKPDSTNQFMNKKWYWQN